MMNFTEQQQNISLDSAESYENMLTGQHTSQQLQLNPYEYVILKNSVKEASIQRALLLLLNLNTYIFSPGSRLSIEVLFLSKFLTY